MQRLKKTLSKTQFAALFQQNPFVESGNIISGEDLRFWKGKTFPHTDIRIISVDLAFGKDRGPEHKVRRDDRSWTVMELWGILFTKTVPPHQYFLLDQVRDKIDFVKQEEALLEFYQQHNTVTKVVIEKAANAEAIYSSLQNRIPVMELSSPNTEKAFRLKAVKRFYINHQVFYPDPAERPWVDVNIAEITRFPKARHDDTVDTASLALMELADNEGLAWLLDD